VQTARRHRKRLRAGRRQGRSRHHPRRSRGAEKRAGRGDAAQECRGAVGAAARQGQRQESGAKITKIAQLSGARSALSAARPANINLLKVILQQYGVDPSKVEIVQFPVTEAPRRSATKGGRLSRRGSGHSKITAEADRGSTKDGGHRRLLAIDSAEAIRTEHALNEARKFPPAPSAARPTVPTTSEDHQLQPPHRRAQSGRNRSSPPSPGNCSRPGSNCSRTSARRQDRNPDTDKKQRFPVHPAPPPSSTARRRPSSTATATTSGGPDGIVGDGSVGAVVRRAI